MASKKKQQNLSKSSQERLAAFEAKQIQHGERSVRRRKDNKIALAAGLIALVLAGGAQFGYGLMPQPVHPAAKHSGPRSTHTADPSGNSASGKPSPSNSGKVPPKTIAENKDWLGSMFINQASLKFTLHGKLAPQAASSFLYLVNKGFYNNLTCHRLTTSGIFVLQCGDPKGDGTGGPGYAFGPIENAPVAKNGVAIYKAGTIAMANSGSAYSNGSQFFIVYKDSPLPPNYTVMATITSGLETLNPIIKAGTYDRSTDGSPKDAVQISRILFTTKPSSSTTPKPAKK